MGVKKQTTKQITVFLGVVFKDNKVLMTLRNEPECPKAHLKWELPGGKIEFTETPKQALAREFLEETGVEIKVKEFLPFVQTSYWDYDWGRTQVFSFGFNCDYVKNIEQVKKDHHVEKVEWVDINKVDKLDSLPGTKEFLKEALKLRSKSLFN